MHSGGFSRHSGNELRAVLVLVVVILLWQFASANKLIQQFLLPTPSSVLTALLRPDVNWPAHIFATSREIIVGFLLGTMIGLALAVLVTESAFLRRTLMPYLVGIEALPKIAIAPLIYILLGFNDLARIMMVILLVFFPVVLSTLPGLVDIDKNLVYLMKTLGAKEMTIFYKVKLPNSAPNLFTGLRLGVLAAVVGSVIAEFISSNVGLGFLIINAQNTFNTSLAFAAFGVLSLLSLGLYGTIEVGAYLLMPWFRKK